MVNLMKYNRRIKNKNIRYFLVGKRVFNSLRAAEVFCNENNLDVNECILSENKDVLEAAKQICFYVLPILHDMKKEISDVYGEQAKVYNRKIDEFKESETKRDLLRGYKEKQMHEAYGILQGIGMVQSIINKQIEVHESVTHLKGGE